MKLVVLVPVLMTAAFAVGMVPPLGIIKGPVKRGPGLVQEEEPLILEQEYDDLLANNTSNGTTTDYTDEPNNSTITDDPDPDNSTATDQTSGSTFTTITTTTTEEPPPNNDLSPGAIAGIVIGTLAGVALIAGGIYYMKMKGIGCFA